jgi:hypothetical protein
VLIEVGVAYKDRECAAGAVRAAVNFVGYVARAAPYDENQSALRCCVCFGFGLCVLVYGFCVWNSLFSIPSCQAFCETSFHHSIFLSLAAVSVSAQPS